MTAAVIIAAALVTLVILAAPVGCLRWRRLMVVRAAERLREQDPAPSALGRECAACGRVLAVLEPKDNCPGCGAAPTDRLLALYLHNETDIFGSRNRRRILQIGGPPDLLAPLGMTEHIDSTPAADPQPAAASEQAPRYDIVLAVVELTQDQLHGLLRPGGWAVIVTNVANNSADASALAASGFRVCVDRYADRLSSEARQRLAVGHEAEVWFCRKPWHEEPGRLEVASLVPTGATTLPGAPTASAPALGRIEAVRDGVVTGWAWNPSRPDARVEVAALVDGELVGVAVAALHRPSLAVGGVGDGRHAFRLDLPASLAGSLTRRLSVRVDGGPLLPPASGFEVSAPRQSERWGRTRFTVEGYAFGRVEEIVGGLVRGWVWSPEAPSWTLGVRLIVDGEPVAHGLADIDRPGSTSDGGDLARRGFAVQLPAMETGAHTLRVEIDERRRFKTEVRVALPPTASFRTADVEGRVAWDLVELESASPISGGIDEISDQSVSGWVMDRDRPQRPVAVSLVVDGRHLGRVRASVEGSGPSGNGAGRPRFSFALPAATAAVGDHGVRVEADDGSVLTTMTGNRRIPVVGQTPTGRVEGVGGGFVWGWAWRPGAPAWRVWVRVLLDGREVAAGAADLARPSLADAGIGDGRHCFRLALPTPYGRAAHRLRVEAEDVPLGPSAAFAVAGDQASFAGVLLAVDGGALDDPAAAIVGQIERIADGVVIGWAFCPKSPDWRLWIRACVDGAEVAGDYADRLRPSLRSVSRGDCCHGFRLELPAGADRGGLVVEAAAGVSLPLANGYADDFTSPLAVLVSRERAVW